MKIFVHMNESSKLEKVHIFRRGHSVAWGVGLVELNATGLMGGVVM